VLRIKLEEFDSLPEIMFCLSNVGVIVLGIRFLFLDEAKWIKYSLSCVMLAFHFIFFPCFLLGCKFDLIDKVTCREGGWLFILIPPPIFLFGIIVSIFIYVKGKVSSHT